MRAAPAPPAPPEHPLTPGVCPFSHPCSEEAKSTTWLHPVTGEAVVTGHRRQSAGNAERGRARAELGAAGRRRQRPGSPSPRDLPPAAVPGRRRGGAEAGGGGRRYRGSRGPAAGLLWSLNAALSFAFHRHLESGALLPGPLPLPYLDPRRPQGGRPPSPGIRDPECFLSRLRLSPSASTPAPDLTPSQPLGSPCPLPSVQPGTLALVRRGQGVHIASLFPGQLLAVVRLPPPLRWDLWGGD